MFLGMEKNFFWGKFCLGTPFKKGMQGIRNTYLFSGEWVPASQFKNTYHFGGSWIPDFQFKNTDWFAGSKYKNTDGFGGL